MTAETNGLASAVAKAILKSVTGDAAGFDRLVPAERQDFLLAAHAAIEAHDTWLTEAGFRIVPPGMASVPTSDAEAMAMMAAIQAYEKQKAPKSALAMPSRKLVLPGLH